ncbi:MAG: GrpB family protein [Pirellulaceae bacterium]
MSQPFRLMSHNPTWKQEYEQTRSSLLQATEGWLTDTMHIGGTGIADAVTRPVIDVMAGLSDLQALNEVSQLIEGLNFRREATPEWCDDELCSFLVKPRTGEATHTVLLVKHEDRIWSQTSRMQKQFESTPFLAAELKQTKVEHYKAGCSAEESYQSAKAVFFADVVDRLQSDQK